MKKLKIFKAFTLVELIIVITILAILSTIAFISYQNYTSNARDSNRQVSLKEISKALEINKELTGKYPTPENIYATGNIIGTNLFQVGTIGDNISKILKIQKTPLDPISGTNYLYGLSLDNKYYQIAGTAENLSAGIFPKTYAESNEKLKAVVEGNYKGLLYFSTLSNNYIANFPSIIFSRSGTYTGTGNYYVVNGKSNIPYSFGKIYDNPKDENAILSELYTSGITLTGSKMNYSINDFLNLKTIPNGVEQLGVKDKNVIGNILFGNSYDNLSYNSSIWKPYVDPSTLNYNCLTDLTQDGANNLNNAFGLTKTISDRCSTNSLYITSYSQSSLPTEFRYLTALTTLTINSSPNLLDVSSIKNLKTLSSVTLNLNSNLQDVEINSPNLKNLILRDYGILKNVKLGSAKNMTTLEIIKSSYEVNLIAPELTSVSGRMFLSNYISSTASRFKFSLPKLASVFELNISPDNRASIENTDYSEFSDVSILYRLVIGLDFSGNYLKLTNPLPVGSTLCNSIIPRLYVFDGRYNANTYTNISDVSYICN